MPSPLSADAPGAAGPLAVASRVFGALLVLVHVGLGAWAAVGFAEMAFDDLPWQRLSNPLFGPAMLALQWSLLAIAAATFVVGYLRPWPALPWAMLVIYGAMATTCVYQTFFILTDADRFRALAIECAEYTLILLFLFFAPYARARFAR